MVCCRPPAASSSSRERADQEELLAHEKEVIEAALARTHGRISSSILEVVLAGLAGGGAAQQEGAFAGVLGQGGGLFKVAARFDGAI
jgi:hypothetical protein